MKNLEATLTFDNLYNWSACQDIVGVTNSSYYCPIARYLDEATGDQWTVDDGCAALLTDTIGETESYQLPTWAVIVADAVDALGSEQITRQQFLAILERIQPESEEQA